MGGGPPQGRRHLWSVPDPGPGAVTRCCCDSRGPACGRPPCVSSSLRVNAIDGASKLQVEPGDTPWESQYIAMIRRATVGVVCLLDDGYNGPACNAEFKISVKQASVQAIEEPQAHRAEFYVLSQIHVYFT
jgi:hypothetical protein